jgi:hypothetical protein
MKHLYLFSLIFAFLTSCQEDLTPSWLVVDNVVFTTNESVEGPNTHDIVDAWVYIDNQSMGVWEIPFRMPVLDEGEHTLLIIPGIKLNGQTGNRTTNAFYETYSTTINLTKEEETKVVPAFKYKSIIKIIARDDFEDTGVILNPVTGEDSTKFEIISKNNYPDIVKYGNNCGMLKLSSADSIVKVVTDLNLPVVQSKMYLELDYLSTNSFAIGIISETSANVQNDQFPFVGAYRTKEDNYEWKKMYFPLSEQINLNPFAQYFEFYIYGALDNDNSEAVIYIDNLKIVYL